MPPARRPGRRRSSPACGKRWHPVLAAPPRNAPAAMRPQSRATLLGQCAYPVAGKAGRSDVERDVEPGTQVAEVDDVGEGDELRRVEVGAQRVEQLVAHLDWGAAHRGGVLEDQRVDVVEAR